MTVTQDRRNGPHVTDLTERIEATVLEHYWPNGVEAGRCKCGQTLEGVISHARHVAERIAEALNATDAMKVSHNDGEVSQVINHRQTHSEIRNVTVGETFHYLYRIRGLE